MKMMGSIIYFILFVGAQLDRNWLRPHYLFNFISLSAAGPELAPGQLFSLFHLLVRSWTGTGSGPIIYFILFVGAQLDQNWLACHYLFNFICSARCRTTFLLSRPLFNPHRHCSTLTKPLCFCQIPRISII